ncbi:MAG: sulfite exporter TauE/SafE family protein [Desulfuromonadaceae bacterium]|nr:sulfite exporter TauE/SafE family protein [Geobacteraceae bacterium]
MFWVAYLLMGAFVGLLAGLFGVGGGIIIVPLLAFLFSAQQFPEAFIIHMALGTSLATIMFTSVSSFRSHHARGAVLWPVVRSITPGILVGTLLGSWVAAQLSSKFLSLMFMLFIFYVAGRMFFNVRPQPKYTLPGTLGVLGMGTLIGGISSLVGIGGGSLSVPFLVRSNQPMHSAVGTSSAIGFPIALAGTIGYVLNGVTVAGLPAGSVGFVYLPALAGIALASVLTAPAGVRLAHALPVARLKKLFALFLLIMGIRMLLSFM